MGFYGLPWVFMENGGFLGRAVGGERENARAVGASEAVDKYVIC